MNYKKYVITQDKEWALRAERNTLKSFLMLGLIFVSTLILIGYRYSTILLVILIYPAYYWLRVLFHNGGKVSYCRNCNNVILSGLKIEGYKYCGDCIIETAHEHIKLQIPEYCENHEQHFIKNPSNIRGRLGN